MIVGFHSYLGAGKSLGSWKFTLDLKEKYPERNYVIYTNLKVLNPEIQWKPIDLDELLRKAIYGKPFDDYYIIWLFDQIENYFDARTSMETKNRIYSYFIQQVRKRHNHLIYTGTSAYLADIRLRNETNYSISCEKRHKDTKGICYDAECERPHYFKYKIIDDIAQKKTGTYRIYNPEEYWVQYDSYDISAPIDTMSERQALNTLSKL